MPYLLKSYSESYDTCSGLYGVKCTGPNFSSCKLNLCCSLYTSAFDKNTEVMCTVTFVAIFLVWFLDDGLKTPVEVLPQDRKQKKKRILYTRFCSQIASHSYY